MSSTTSHSTTTLISGAVLLKGSMLEPVSGQAVVIKNECIVRIAPEHEIAVGKDWRVIDAGGKTVLPGLIDAHIPFFGSRRPRSEESRVGKECVRTCRYRWSPYP